MPSSSPELRARWSGIGTEGECPAITHLTARGYTITWGFCWLKPAAIDSPSEEDLSALQYLTEEWDFGGLA